MNELLILFYEEMVMTHFALKGDKPKCIIEQAKIVEKYNVKIKSFLS